MILGSIEWMQDQINKLEQALNIVANAGGDYTQNIVNDALYEVGYYTYEDEDEVL